MAARIVDSETMEPRGANEAGLLMVKGANRMIGYVEKSAPEEDWYTTGDIAVLDDEGFLRITDRLSRFSKIGGEMVPHLKITRYAGTSVARWRGFRVRRRARAEELARAYDERPA